MAKESVKVDNKLEEIKLTSGEEITKNTDKKKKVKKDKKPKETKENKNKESFFAEVRKELKNVTWISRKTMLKYSVITICMILFLALFFIAISAIFDLLYALVQGWIG